MHNVLEVHIEMTELKILFELKSTEIRGYDTLWYPKV